MKRIHHTLRSHPATALLYRSLVILAAIVIIAAGIAMLVLPGPGLLAIFFGLTILGTEVPWAKRLTLAITERAVILKNRFLAWRQTRRDMAANSAVK